MHAHPARILLLAAGLAATPAFAQSTAFTYQGRLTNAGQPANGTYDIRFRLYNAPSGGVQAGATFCADNIAVSGGLFTATVDVGQQYATGEPRYLEIEVRPDTGLSCANTSGYTVLAPRQQLTDTPRAMVANVAHSLAIPNGSSLNAVALDNSGNVGMGTATPTSHLDIFGTQDALKLRGPGPFMTLVDTAASNTRVLLQNSAGRYYVVPESFLNGSNTGAFTVVDPQGRLGIGTHNPAGPLDVRSGNASFFYIDPVHGDMMINGGSDGFGGIHNLGIAGGGTGITSNFGANFFVANTGNVGIGTTAPAAKLDVNGNARVAGTITHGAVTRAYTIHGTELGPGTSSEFTTYDDQGVKHVGSADNFYASPHLPDGATIIALTLYGHDGYPPADMTCTLGRTNFTGFTAELASVVTDLGGQAWQTTSIAYPIVENNTHAYWVRVTMGGGGDPTYEHRVYAVRILYSITQPLP